MLLTPHEHHSLDLLVVAFVHGLAALTPTLALGLARGRLRRSSRSSAALPDTYRSAPLPQRSWHVSGPFPWWAVMMAVVCPLTDVVLGWLFQIGWIRAVSDSDIMRAWLVAALVLLLAALTFGGSAWLWIRWCLRDARRVGVMERMTMSHGRPGLTLHALRESRPVRMVSWNKRARTFRLSESSDVWHAVEPIDDLVDTDAAGTA